MEDAMQIPAKSLSALVVVLLVAACGMSSDPNQSSANGGGVIQGTVSGGPQNMLVAVPSGSAAATTNATGGFILTDVPRGATALHFSGGGRNAALAMPAMVAGEFRHLAVRMSGDSASEENEQTETEFEGTVDAIDGTVLTVAGREVAVTDATKIRKEHAPATFADLKLGTPVEVEGTLNADGTVTASEIGIEDESKADRTVLVGMLTQISGDTLTVGGVTVNVSSTTMIVRGDTPLALADLKVGDRLLVRGAVQTDMSVNATRVRVLQRENEDEDENEAEEMHVTGQVAAVGTNTFTIGETVITTDAKTEFEGTGFHSLADLKVGDFAFAEVMKQADGSLLAQEVKRFAMPVMPPLPPMPPVMPPMPSM
jgi:hypothetical protein